MQMFREVIDECGFMDLGYVGPKYTWSRHFENGSSIWERLDRCLATSSWFLKFPGSKVYHLRCDSSDHIPLHIVLSDLVVPKRKKLFRFEEMWLSNGGCEEVVFSAWKSGSRSEDGDDKLAKVEKCGKDLTWWDKNAFGNVRRELDRLRKLLTKAKSEAMISGSNFRVLQLKKEIDVLLDRESTMWAQRSRLLWARQRDRNTKYFHSQATRRHRRNKVEGIRDEEGNWREKQNDVAEVLVEYFKGLFTASELNGSQEVLSSIPTIIDEEMNTMLGQDFSEQEVAASLKQMAPLKAPGPDGMPPRFYQHFWGTVSHDVTSSILAWLNSGTLPTPLNHTFIALIPKIHNPEHAHQYRPISLCNVLYKIYSKVLANRLKKLMPHIITEHQSAFTKDRLISDNILVAFETLHSLKNYKSTSHGFMALKLDMSKAYDRVVWNFLNNL
ncbi:hypothetical protein SO802_008174 [Lithocarpus litseifolius]|uniref:Reverse transcriptase domain-containing protein n=1 Tax=Lithocarpus litseifolius TaxID=425828 RepID=A0AAW2D8E9_9ROSI